MILKPVMRPAMRSPMGSAMDWGRSNNPNAEAIALLRKFNASVWLFCSGNVGGLQAGNYLDSTLGTPASIDGPIGGMLDAMGGLGPNILHVENLSWFAGDEVSPPPPEYSFVGGQISYAPTVVDDAYVPAMSSVWSSPVSHTTFYRVMYDTLAISGNRWNVGIDNVELYNGPNYSGGYTPTGSSAVGRNSFTGYRGYFEKLRISCYNNTPVTFDNFSYQEIIGNPATQPTTANKPVLRVTGGKYYGEFDGINDSLLTGNLALTNTFSIVVAGNLSSLPSQQTLIGEDTGGAQVYVTSGGAIVFAKVGTGVLATTAAGEVVAGTPFVATATLAGGNAIIRKNGVQKVSTASALTLSATTGARIGGTFAGAEYCAGSLSALSVLQGAATNAELLTVEKWAASITPGGPTI